MSAEQPEQPAPAGGGMLGKILIAGFMGVVILTECLLAYFWIPSAEQVAVLAEERMTKKLHELNEEPDAILDGKKSKEFDLGDYSLTSHQPSTNSSLRIDFKLAGTVLEEDEEKLKTLFETNKNRFRDQVIFEIRNSEVDDLMDPGLGLIKRRILEKSNRLFREALLKEVLVTDFSLIEQ